jgi:hypothetical protein
MFNSKAKKTSNGVPNISIRADAILGDKRVSKALSTSRVGKNVSQSNRSQSSAFLNLISNINTVVSPRNSINNFLKKTMNDYPAVLTTMNSNNDSHRVYTLPNKNMSRDHQGAPILTEPSVSNATIAFANELKVPSKIKDKVNNLRLYSKPKAVDFTKGYNNKGITGGIKNTSINKTNFSIKNLELKTSFQMKSGEGKYAVLPPKSTKGGQSLANLGIKRDTTRLSKDHTLRNTFVVNNTKDHLALLKKQKENTKHAEYKKLCENELFKSLEIEKGPEISEDNNNNVSDDALSAGEVQDIIRAFNFNDPEYKESSLFGSKKESYFNTNLKHKYVNYLFTSVIQDRYRFN